MPRGGARIGAGRKANIPNKQPRKDSKMSVNNFKEFFNNLCIELLNHRYGDSPVTRTLYILKRDGKCQIRKSDVVDIYGVGARDVLNTFFSFESKRPYYDNEGKLVNGEISTMTVTNGQSGLLYDYLESEGLIDRLRRDKEDGIFDAWATVQEFLREKRQSWSSKTQAEKDEYFKQRMKHVAKWQKKTENPLTDPNDD